MLKAYTHASLKRDSIFNVHLGAIWGMNKVWAFNTYSAGIDFRRQYLTSVDVRFWRLKSILALNEFKYL